MDISGCKKLIVFGGSFDPVHNAHISLPMEVCKLLKADGVIYVPAGNAPHKQDQDQTCAEHRLAMLELALRDVPDVHIVTSEIDKAGHGLPTYTIDTLLELREQVGEKARLRLLIGGDMLRIFDTWRDAEKIIELAEPLVMVRPPDTRETLLESLPVGYDPVDWAGRLLDVSAMDISSSGIRRRVREKLDISNMVPEEVEQYIRQQELYL